MKVPPEFEVIAGNIGGFFHIEELSPEQWVESAVKQFRYTHPDNRHFGAVRQYLDLLLTRDDETELKQAWNSTSAGFTFRDAAELRTFLGMIRDAMAKGMS